MSNSLQHSKQAGFTLIEILVTMTLTALVMMGITSLFITFIVSAGKSRISQGVRENGTVAMQKMIEEIRNAREIGGGSFICDGATANLSLPFVSADQIISSIEEIDDKITIIKTTDNYYLTSDFDVSVDNLQDLNFTCYLTSSGKYVEISFTLRTSDSANPSTTHSQLDFQSGVTLRN